MFFVLHRRVVPSTPKEPCVDVRWVPERVRFCTCMRTQTHTRTHMRTLIASKVEQCTYLYVRRCRHALVYMPQVIMHSSFTCAHLRSAQRSEHKCNRMHFGSINPKRRACVSALCDYLVPSSRGEHITLFCMCAVLDIDASFRRCSWWWRGQWLLSLFVFVTETLTHVHTNNAHPTHTHTKTTYCQQIQS